MFKIKNAIKKINKIIDNKKIEVAIVAGSGQVDSMPELENKVEINYKDLKFPSSKVKGHSGKFVFGTYNGKNIMIMSRFHYYENGNFDIVKIPFMVAKNLGVKKVFLLTSSGGINETFNVGDLVIIKDHINATGINPLIAEDKIDFIPMSKCYDLALIEQAKKIAVKSKIDIKTGVHAQMMGPSFETDAEIAMLKSWGVDTVSMSTVYDCIICRKLEISVFAMSIVTNVYAKQKGELSHSEVLANAKLAEKKIKTILCKLI